MSRKSWGLGLTVLTMLVLILILVLNNPVMFAASSVSPTIGHLAPDFSLDDLDGKSIDLKSVVVGHKVTLVNFWATWCPPCRGEIPELIRFYQKNAGRKVALVAVNLQEEPDPVRKFARQARMNFPVLLDIHGKIAGAYRIYAIPTTFMIDRHGIIREIISGGTDLVTLETKLQSLLKEK